MWSVTAAFPHSSPSPDGVTTTLTRQESIEKVRKRTRPIPSLAACALCPRASEAFLVSLCARVTQDQDKAKSDQVMMGLLARLEFGWAECADSTNFVQTIFVPFAPYIWERYVPRVSRASFRSRFSYLRRNELENEIGTYVNCM